MVKILIEFASGTGLSVGFKVASKLGYLEIVKLLLQYGVDQTRQNSYAIRCASKNGHLEIVKLLLEHGYNPTELAIRNANTEEMRELLVQWKYRVDGKEYCKAKEMFGFS
jgi:ankyrin repeat protein